MQLKTIDEINKDICKALNVDYSKFQKMSFSDQQKIVRRYTTEVSGLKFKNHK